MHCLRRLSISCPCHGRPIGAPFLRPSLLGLCTMSRSSHRGRAQGRGGRGGRGGGGGGRGGGEQRWWDPAWRAERLRQMREERGPDVELDEDEWWTKLEEHKFSDEEEIVIKTNYGRAGADKLEAMARESGFYFHAYNRGRNTVLVISKAPLPNYRADLDEKHGQSQRKISISADTETHVESMLAKSIGKISVVKDCAGTSSHGDDSTLDERRKGVVNVNNTELSARLKARQKELQAGPAAKSMTSFRKKLPAFKMKDEILQAVSQNQVLVVSGETGCGKTTQLPQFILEEEINAGRGAACDIICTQPRRISAISVATRVADERGDELGESVGYQIRLEARRSQETRLLFCTTGVLLRRLVQDPLLEGVSHVIVDEIHERGMNEDFLLVVLRDLLPKRPKLRLILMSATINADMFSKYFGNAPKLHIPGFTFPVREFFLEDVVESTGFQSQNNQASSRFSGGRRIEKQKDSLTELFEEVVIQDTYKQFSKSTRKYLECWNPEIIDLDLVEAAIQHICEEKDDGAILVFLTGWDDISKLLDKLKLNPSVRNELLLPLHGSMPTINQRQIFQRPPPGVRKIVLATNIAETSITIDDVVYVIDCGKAKETSYDALNKLACLLPSWISRAAAHQRRGRAGRVQPGICFHLYPKLMYDAMAQYQLPEILRTPLESLCLQIKSLQVGSIAKFLSKALEPPELRAVDNAIESLKTIGALDDREELTSLGRHLTTLPLDPKVGKMLLMGAIFQCLDPALTIAAALAHRDPFVIPIDKRDAADEAKRRLAGNARSDHLALMRAYEGYIVAKRHGRERNYCWENFLSAQTLQWMDGAREQFYDHLSKIGFVDNSSNSANYAVEFTLQCLSPTYDAFLVQAYNKHSDDLEMVRAVLCAGLYPNVVQCKARGRRTAFFTKDDGKVEPHPASVNSRVGQFAQPWLVYSEKVKTTGIYLRDTTNISDYALLMFGGPLVSNGKGVEMLDGYLQFTASAKTMELVNALRSQLDDLLTRKIKDPRFDIHREGKHVVSAVLALLHCEEKQYY
ncbi:DExH-box ATP-dependent RNA helicase DExH1 isoform X2 [Selaginella moellendorffii]|uniref:DExH-box ATP-dependent RNA helicase DExH1 isoform X2 n=1 Tax=Selaginella moellendorffii TaxID=88036 RepID=UPI000D1C3DBE|nr:DExH-box ATP-dependent RNA helicase DExH1 isoform X2 [Selaginella moellendorffii]|eukprot:XP_024533616.1 DExH-box ATP-dependent RNA helicase DExH1 isoform X2 [Selaginella moellendorffii]